MKKVPDWIDRSLYPFDSRWITLEGSKMHYIDAGAGDIILFVHGTPEWSFAYRNIILALQNNFRCIAVDLLGFGLSDKPPHVEYTCEAHARRLKKFIDALELQNITLMANDFGGGIGVSYAINRPDNVKNIILYNTWMWSLKEDPHYQKAGTVLNTWFGKFLYLRLNFAVNAIMPAAYGDRKKLSATIHKHYRKALAQPACRTGTYVFGKELLQASWWWEDLWTRADVLAHKRLLLFWGLRDKFIPPYELGKWQKRFPHAQTVTYTDAGHFLSEEKAEEMAAEVRSFLKKGDYF